MLLFFIAFILQCGYAIYFFGRVFLFSFQSNTERTKKLQASVIICAKNEADNLASFLPLILTQRHRNEIGEPQFEVIVANDASEDETLNVLQQLQLQFDHLKIVSIDSSETRILKGKKHALSKGVEAAQFPILVFTDADCKPSDEYWLQNIMEPFYEGREIVAGYGAYEMEKGFLNLFIRFETLQSFMQFGSYAFAGNPFMAVGRNLACTKNIFLDAQQHKLWNLLSSGDDDMLMRIAANGNNTTVVAQSFTISKSKTSWKEWLHQKQRHSSTGKYYKPLIKILLAGYAFSHAFLWFAFLVLCCSSFIKLSLVLMMIRCLLVWLPLGFLSIKMKERNLLTWIPLLDFCWCLYNLLLSPYIFFKNKQTWK
jgi:glycosyltransferase involved in cell wall biosynthesis